nr:N-acetylmuramoyl-L-alanine amidase [[Clostridium] scindens]
MEYFISEHNKTVEDTNSSLVSYTKLSPNHSGQRTHSIDRITPHCVVGQLTAESICGCFTSTSRQASCNYGIGTDGKVALCVEEKNRSWCSSSSSNDQRAVTIECASDKTEPYAMNSKVYNSLVKLCTDICKRNGKKKLLWLGDKDKTLNYSPKSDEMVLTVHRWFANKSCPGNWLYAKLGDLATEVTTALGTETGTSTSTKSESTSSSITYKVKVSISDLNIRKGPGTNYAKTGKYTGKGTFTIVETKSGKGSTAGWGKLKSGAGWISLDYAKKL